MATMTAAALTSGGNGGGRGVGEVESSEGGKVLNLQALGVGVGCGTVDEPTEESAGEGEGGDHCHCYGFYGRGRARRKWLPKTACIKSSIKLCISIRPMMHGWMLTNLGCQSGNRRPIIATRMKWPCTGYMNGSKRPCASSGSTPWKTNGRGQSRTVGNRHKSTTSSIKMFIMLFVKGLNMKNNATSKRNANITSRGMLGPGVVGECLPMPHYQQARNIGMLGGGCPLMTS